MTGAQGQKMFDSNGQHSSSQAEELSRLLGELAHEIKNPLSTIKVNLRLVEEELQGLISDGSVASGGERARRLGRASRKVSVIQRETDRLEQILEAFLRYVDRTEPQLQGVDINGLVSDMVDFYSPQAHSYSITLRHQLHNEPLVCRVDVHMLKQALLNLFINAQQAMENGGELMVRTGRKGEKAQIQVCDTGKGIKADGIGRIFDAYYSTRPQGSGLGLPTAKRIVESHRGTIIAASEPGKGTCFTIELPIAAASLEQTKGDE